ncbi:pyrroline-5-carboxylate reductase [Arenibaculum pallidiluteum]|uniref:pyrroline-5-carboxylate reductase n=1 Tax=Arenibaculum pallidiluteum TaxID=2812559 RepID=UPI002E2E0164|nr:pyrroline-5-carboxylate reductase [Arenibaculum pallidiluteum]
MAASLLLVGCGKMGSAMLEGWLASGVADRIVVVEPQSESPQGSGGADPRVIRCADAAGIPSGFRPDALVMAVKPQVMDAAVAPYAGSAGAGAVVLSIAAGKTIGYFEARLGAGAAVVRAMPNTPAAIGRGITVACANAQVTPAQRVLCESLLAAVGEVGWVEDESLIDAVTGVSGSGPAYVFLLCEALAEAGRAAGLPEDLATRLARATVSGAGELLHRSPESAGQLRRNVTSPNGTTQAALDVLMAPSGLAALMTEAVAAATRRSRELAS